MQADIAVTAALARQRGAGGGAGSRRDPARGDAEASAITARAKALGDNPNLVSLTQAEKWDGKLPATMVPGGSVPMIALGK